MKNELVLQVAIQEVLTPSLSLSEQYLAVHEISSLNGIPIVERIDKDSDDGTVVVYFPIEGESYYLAITVETEPDVYIRGLHFTAANRVYLVVSSEELDVETLISMVGVKPTKSWTKGDCISTKSTLKHEDSGFTYEPNPERADELEDKLQKLLSGLQAVKGNIINLSKQPHVHIQINICYDGYKDQMNGWHLDSKTLLAIAEINASIDFDIYAGGPDLPQDF